MVRCDQDRNPDQLPEDQCNTYCNEEDDPLPWDATVQEIGLHAPQESSPKCHLKSTGDQEEKCVDVHQPQADPCHVPREEGAAIAQRAMRDAKVQGARVPNLSHYACHLKDEDDGLE